MKPEDKIVKIIDGQNTTIQATVSQMGSSGALNVTPISSPPTTTLINGTVALSQTDNVSASTKTVTKVINSVTYTKTLSFNASGQFLSATAWS